ncbi:Membrane protein insertase YidC [Candidatus Xiphinematobacter sp. Idaho Grape]|uniref:YidC/Oxa1 family insertase periplasmic-domain containing protein n=1 Tax=Candidatus Xiphinematobacter sp. Idaho Grape TaxID=1704307 RepID=UPI000705EE4D|nr:YidC/Oxa1 family insertase periplasmic-domain containing protein [Candidatus Xiphinematobacter sp. Idaho Grape]ALJ56600.1 Membrane protein insertase YidC [Candidatus Xiphinematobacter sp. Idaho Grape]
MDRKSWIGLILSITGLIAWEWFYLKNFAPGQDYSKSPSQATSAPSFSVPSSPRLPPSPLPIISETAMLRNSTADYWFTGFFGGISKIVVQKHLGDDRTPILLSSDSRLPIGALWVTPTTLMEGFAMTTDRATHSVTFTKASENGIQITKRFFLLPDKDRSNQYRIRLEVSFCNPTSSDIYWPSYWISVGNAAPIHSSDLPSYTQLSWSNGGRLTSINVDWFDGSKIPLLGIERRTPAKLYQRRVPSVKWASVSNQYFCTFLMVSDSSGDGVWASRIPLRGDSQSYGIEGRIELPGFRLASGKTRVQSFTIYSGPKELNRLQVMGDGQEGILQYGLFGFVSERLLWIMNWFYGVFGNYAWAIIALTLLIKLGLWPLQNRATRAMRQMSLLAPKVTELREKYKDDSQKTNEEMMKLYREYGVNPFGGCLPMLVQIPIFFGFYTMLGTSIELRNSSFLWIRDLSQPDTVLHLLGFPINLLPILMAGTMIWQMAISPKSGDVLQQKIFYFMPLIFLAFCYNYASGLALYWTTQNVFSIVQLYLTRNSPLPQLERKVAITRKKEHFGK